MMCYSARQDFFNMARDQNFSICHNLWLNLFVSGGTNPVLFEVHSSMFAGYKNIPGIVNYECSHSYSTHILHTHAGLMVSIL